MASDEILVLFSRRDAEDIILDTDENDEDVFPELTKTTKTFSRS